MKAFTSPLHELGEFEELQKALKTNTGVLEVTGCIDAQKTHFMSTLAENVHTKLIITYSEQRAREIEENYRFFDRKTALFPAKDFIFYQADVHSNLIERQRIQALKALCDRQPVTVITTIQALMNHGMPFDEWKKAAFTLKAGDELDLSACEQQLVRMGYERTAQVNGPGQFAVRGGILDIFPLTGENPCRIELFGDEIDGIRMFDAQTQRSIENCSSVMIYPATEMILGQELLNSGFKKIEKEAKTQETKLRKAMLTEEAFRVRSSFKELKDQMELIGSNDKLESYIGYFYSHTENFADYFPPDTVIFLDEPNRLMESAQASETEYRESMKSRLEKGYALPTQANILYSAQETANALNHHNCVGLCMIEGVRGAWQVSGRYSIQTASISPYNNDFEMLVKDLTKWKKKKYRVILLSASKTRGLRLAADLQERDLNAVFTEDADREVLPSQILVMYGNAHRGYEYPMIRFAVVTETDIFGREKKKRTRQRVYEGTSISSFEDLTPGDYVVHESHGLGIYRGIEKIEVDHVMKDYMRIEYQGGSSLYVLASNFDVIQKYADADVKKPKLNKLGSQDWNRTKSRVKGAVAEIAQELVDLYAARQNAQGFQFSPDTVWQQEFEELFPYEETDDQRRAIDEVKSDMESTKIMDRLICGDVGYGKTEIAIRAAFKAVQDGKQVAFLVPTTILAQQHYNTFVERLKSYPVTIGLMCRFRSASEQKETLKKLAAGQVDIVIGTHRLLSKDVSFKNLGLLVVDEEQRFGVTHKEKIKQMKKNVDVLTLTATPIPRTLHMSLVGIRDMSVLQEPPQDRLPIQTFVMEYNEEIVREAITRELARGGQVYYVYNRVNTIMDMADRLQKLLPEARVAFAHGQMAERELEKIMYDFINGDIDVLVTTTIIETGLDIPNANTMIIHDADQMGLAQLYQLRGRIGRSSRTSFAFLMYKRDKMLKEIAEKRLSAIREFTELGSGFKIAMRDLEIRGAGSVLGEAQSGHIADVGYDLYCKLLNESVRQAKGEDVSKEDFDTSIDLDMDAFIPDSYIGNGAQKMDIYRRIASISTQNEYDDMLEELLDRFGDPPKSVQNLLQAALLKAMAHQDYLTDVTQKGNVIRLTFYEKAKIDVTKLQAFISFYGGRMKMTAGKAPVLVYTNPIRGGREGSMLVLVREILDKLNTLVI